jgi:xanthine dehydrogenase YagT iron-sulfur-binding subunit
MKKRTNKNRPERLTRSEHELSRRAFIETAGAAIVVATALPTLAAQTPATATAAPAAIAVDPSVPRTSIRVTVNGAVHRVEVEDRWTLVELLRDRLGLTGTKIGCDRGECGACTVLLDDKPIYSCSNLAVWADGKSITTVEGLAKNGTLTALQAAFVAHDAAQCGFCTSGQLMTATALLSANPHPTAEQARDAMYGNLCRCANYNRYIESVVAAGSTSTRATAGGAQ